jgi:hypothetical protein
MGGSLTEAHPAFMAQRRGAVYRSTEHRPFLRTQNSTLHDHQISAVFVQEYAENLFKALGAQTVDSLDASDYEGAIIIEDLNQPIRDNLKLGYSALVDFGSLQLIFNVAAALKNCIDMVEVGGWYMYCGPCNHIMGHGFYQFSPGFFFNFLSHNGFEEIEVLIWIDHNPIFFRVADPALCPAISNNKKRRKSYTNTEGDSAPATKRFCKQPLIQMRRLEHDI